MVVKNKRKNKTMEKNDLKIKLEENVILSPEYNDLFQNRYENALPLYQSFPFLSFLIIVPIVQRMLFLFFIKYFKDSGYTFLVLYPLILAGILFIIYRIVTKPEIKIAAWVWMIIMIVNTILSCFNYLLPFFYKLFL